MKVKRLYYSCIESHYLAENIQQWEWNKESSRVHSNGLVEAKITAVEEYWPLNATSLIDFEADIKNVILSTKARTGRCGLGALR